MEEMAELEGLWSNECQELSHRLKTSILAGPVLANPYPSLHFYLKTDWSKDRTGAVLLQADDSEESRQAEKNEAEGRK